VAKKPWGGVFQQATDRRVEAFSESISFDRRLYAQDIACNRAHAKMLAHVGLITAEEFAQIEAGLVEIGAEIERGDFPFRTELEDIHMHIERALVERLDDVGRKLHTARSRNDQVTTDLRLWVRAAVDMLDHLLVGLQRAFVGRCERDRDVILPGYTHMQRAQPVLAPHYWLAYCEKFERDRTRLSQVRRSAGMLTLGTAALAGTTLPIDREFVRRELGFESLAANSIDASSDRDFALEFAFACTVIATHLSTWAEEWILWSTTEFGFLKLPQDFCTGSSIMPQKVNPDVLELTRGRSARVIGNLQALLVLVKGLPLAYNRDLQEDKEPLFDSFDTVRACLELAAPLVAGAELKRESIAAGLDRGHLDATTLMEHMIRLGVPQRTAHHICGNLVRTALDRGVALAELPVEEFQQAHELLDERVYSVLGPEQAVSAFTSYGSTAPAEVDRQIASWRQRLSLDAQPDKTEKLPAAAGTK